MAGLIGTPTDLSSNRNAAVAFDTSLTPPAGFNRACFVLIAVDNNTIANPGITTPTYDGVAMEVVGSPFPLVNSDRLIAAYGIPVADAASGAVTLSFTKVDITNAYLGKAYYCDNVDPADLANTVVTGSQSDVATTLNVNVTNPDTTNGLVLVMVAAFDDANTVTSAGEGTPIGSALTNPSPTGGDHNMYYHSFQSTGDATVATSFTCDGNVARLRVMGFSINHLLGSGGGGGGSNPAGVKCSITDSKLVGERITA